MNNNITWFPDSLLAWEYFNEVFLSGEEGLPFVFQKNATYLYDVVFGIMDPRLPSNIDFGKLFNYSQAKWRLLVSNYLDEFVINKTKREVTDLHKKGLIYNYSMSFTNNHGCGKKCLLSIVFSKRCKENNVKLLQPFYVFYILCYLLAFLEKYLNLPIVLYSFYPLFSLKAL